MHCIGKLHRAQRPFNHPENRSQGPKKGLYRRAVRQVGTARNQSRLISNA